MWAFCFGGLRTLSAALLSQYDPEISQVVTCGASLQVIADGTEKRRSIEFSQRMVHREPGNCGTGDGRFIADGSRCRAVAVDTIRTRAEYCR